MLGDLIPAITELLSNNVKAANPKITPEARDIIVKVVSDSMAPLIPELYESTLKLYADNFTDADLTAAIAFYRTQAGQHMLQKLPQLTQQGMQLGQSIVVKHLPEIQARLIEEFKNHNIQLK
jgi:hypothetical protein